MTDAARCVHPSNRVVYYSEIDDRGGEFEDYWCADCNFWLTPGEMQEIRMRKDWNGGITEYDVLLERRPLAEYQRLHCTPPKQDTITALLRIRQRAEQVRDNCNKGQFDYFDVRELFPMLEQAEHELSQAIAHEFEQSRLVMQTRERVEQVEDERDKLKQELLDEYDSILRQIAETVDPDHGKAIGGFNAHSICRAIENLKHERDELKLQLSATDDEVTERDMRIFGSGGWKEKLAHAESALEYWKMALQSELRAPAQGAGTWKELYERLQLELAAAKKACSFCGQLQGHAATCWTVAIVNQRNGLRSALERVKWNFELLLAGKPVKEAQEALGEATSALAAVDADTAR